MSSQNKMKGDRNEEILLFATRRKKMACFGPLPRAPRRIPGTGTISGSGTAAAFCPGKMLLATRGCNPVGSGGTYFVDTKFRRTTDVPAAATSAVGRLCGAPRLSDASNGIAAARVVCSHHAAE